jgi:hypothetical protein
MGRLCVQRSTFNQPKQLHFELRERFLKKIRTATACASARR